jgi:cell division septation protein DedD
MGTAAAAVVGVAVSGLSMGVPGYRGAFGASVLPVPPAPAAIVAPVAAPIVPATPRAAVQGAEVAPTAVPAAAPATVPVAVSPAVPAREVGTTASKFPAAADDDKQSYVLEVALFTSVGRGTRLVEELVAAGFQAFEQPLVDGTRGTFRQVLVGPFATRDDADRDLKRLRQRGGYSDARVTARVPLRSGRTAE